MNVKKILLVGNFNNNPKIYTYASSFYKAMHCNAMQNLGLTVEKFNYKNSKFNTPILKNIIGVRLINYSLLRTVKTFKPDLIFMLKADNITAKTLNNIKTNNKNIKIINFYPDNPFTFWNGNSNANILLSLPVYDLFLIWSHQLIPILYSSGAKNVRYFPFGFDESIFSQEIQLSENDHTKYQSDICFVGSWDAEREAWLTKLMHKIPALNLAIWGNRWNENLPQNSILKTYLKGCAIYGIDMMKAFRLSKIVLNFIRKQNLDAHNMRTIEVAACKSFLLTERTKDQAELLFKEGVSIECFKDIDDLTSKINFYLSNHNARATITQNGYEEAQKYSIENLLLETFKKFI
ncbi:MAG: glycosyltransferase [Candidatus Babeliales bacterium]